MLIGFAVCRAAFTLAVGARAALWAAVAARVIPRLFCSFTVIAVVTEESQTLYCVQKEDSTLSVMFYTLKDAYKQHHHHLVYNFR